MACLQCNYWPQKDELPNKFIFLHFAILNKSEEPELFEEINVKSIAKFLEIFQDGKVAPCEILETISDLEDPSMGNLKNFDFNVQKLLESNQAKKIVQYIKDSKCHCTFECPKHMDALYNKKLYPELFKNLAKHYIFSK